MEIFRQLAIWVSLRRTFAGVTRTRLGELSKLSKKKGPCSTNPFRPLACVECDCNKNRVYIQSDDSKNCPKPTDRNAAVNNANPLHKSSFFGLGGPDAVVAIKIHDLAPCGHKVFHKLLLRSGTCVYLRERTKL